MDLKLSVDVHVWSTFLYWDGLLGNPMGVKDLSNAGIGGMIISVWVDTLNEAVMACPGSDGANGPQTLYVVPL